MIESDIKLVSIHIPKVAGTSLWYSLREVYGYRQPFRFICKKTGLLQPLVRVDIFDDDQLLLNDKIYTKKTIPPCVTAIHGHFYFDKLKKTINLDADPFIITWLRNPADRLVSNHLYFRKIISNSIGHKHTRDYAFPLMEKNFMQFVRDPRNQNLMTRYLKGLELAKINFIGLQEHYESSLKMLSDMLKWPNTKPFNLNKTNLEKTSLTLDEKQEIAELNALDFDLYEYAKSRIGVK